MSPETPLAIIAPCCNENTTYEQRDKGLVESQQLQPSSSLSQTACEEKIEMREKYPDCDAGSEESAKDSGSDTSTLRYDPSSGVTPHSDQVLKSALIQPSSTWGTSSQDTSNSKQNYDLCSSDKNYCHYRRVLTGDSVGNPEEGSASTENSSTSLTGSFVNMHHDSDYVNLHQRPQEVLHWYRTERVSGEQDEWEVVEVGFDGTMDGAEDKRTLEVVDSPIDAITPNSEEIQLLGLQEKVVQLEREVVGGEVLAETDLVIGIDGVVDCEDSDSDERDKVDLEDKQPYSIKVLDACRDIECCYPQSEEDFPFGGLDGASESKIAPPRPAKRYYRAGRPVQVNKSTMSLAAAQGGLQQPKSPEREFAKNWLQTQIQRAKSLPDHLKSNEDRLLEWLNTDIDDETAPLSAEVASFTMQMFGLLKPGGAFGGLFAPGGVMAAHPGTFLAAHSAVLGVLPAIGMSKCNCVHCNQEVGALGSGVWWRCKGCPMGKGFICGDCFLKGGKCGGGHKIGIQYAHGNHVLVRGGYTASVEDFNIRFHNEWQGGLDLGSDNETYSPPRPTRRSKSESYPVASPTQSRVSTLSSAVNKASRNEEFLFPLAPQSGSVEHTPPRKYSPPPHVPKPQTGSVSSLLPAIPTPSLSPPPRETLRQKLGTAALATADSDRDSTTPLLSISVPGSLRNEGRELGSELMTFHVSKSRTGVANNSASTLGFQHGEEENYTGVGTGGQPSNTGSDDGSGSSGSMTTGAGGYKEIPWRRGNTKSPGPSELIDFEQTVGLGAVAVLGSAALGLELESRPGSVDLTLTMPGTPGWKEERERLGVEKERERLERERKQAEVVVKLPPPLPPQPKQKQLQETGRVLLGSGIRSFRDWDRKM